MQHLSERQQELMGRIRAARSSLDPKAMEEIVADLVKEKDMVDGMLAIAEGRSVDGETKKEEDAPPEPEDGKIPQA